mgnify:CR=1 FL=1
MLINNPALILASTKALVNNIVHFLWKCHKYSPMVHVYITRQDWIFSRVF